MKTAVLLMFLVGCFSPDVTDGGLMCAEDGACPTGFSCYSGQCWSHDPTVTVPKHLNEPCEPINPDTTDRTDDCSAGLVCVDGDAGSTCLKTCVINADCGTTRCEIMKISTTLDLFAQVCGQEP